jgi:hypothetical protein
MRVWRGKTRLSKKGRDNGEMEREEELIAESISRRMASRVSTWQEQ